MHAPERRTPAPVTETGDARCRMRGEAGFHTIDPAGLAVVPREGDSPSARTGTAQEVRYSAPPGRSGRVAEGGALLRR